MKNIKAVVGIALAFVISLLKFVIFPLIGFDPSGEFINTLLDIVIVVSSMFGIVGIREYMQYLIDEGTQWIKSKTVWGFTIFELMLMLRFSILPELGVNINDSMWAIVVVGIALIAGLIGFVGLFSAVKKIEDSR